MGILIRCAIVAVLVGGLHWWARNTAPRVRQRHPENTWFEGGKL